MGTTSAAAKKRWVDATEEQRRAMGRRTADDPLEFFRRVDKNGPTRPHMKTRCWVWTGSKRGGYGRFTVRGKNYNAHVRALEMKLGRPLMSGKKACHHCDVRLCVRQDHLFEGTQRENILDSVRKGGHKNPIHRGEFNPGSKLTAEQVAKLRAHPPERHEKVDVAKSLGITRHSLNRILRGERW
jgi:hypothetical protein